MENRPVGEKLYFSSIIFVQSSEVISLKERAGGASHPANYTVIDIYLGERKMLDSFSSNVLKSLLGCCLMIICSSVGVRAMSSGYSGSPVSSVSWFPCFSFFQQACQNGPKWTKNAPNGRYHAPDFSLKNAKLRLNIIIIDILRAACVFIAFTFPQPSENEV